MYIHEQVPPSKKDLKKLELFNSVLATVDPSSAEVAPTPDLSAGDVSEPDLADADVPAAVVPAAAPAKKTRGRVKKA
jgi:hypothetical protein